MDGNQEEHDRLIVVAAKALTGYKRRAFIAGLGMPRSLRAVNVGRDAFDRMAEQAMGTPWVPRNPRHIDGAAQVREILELAA